MNHVNESEYKQFVEKVKTIIDSKGKNAIFLAAIDLDVSVSHLNKVMKGLVPLTEKFKEKVLERIGEIESKEA